MWYWFSFDAPGPGAGLEMALFGLIGLFAIGSAGFSAHRTAAVTAALGGAAFAFSPWVCSKVTPTVPATATIAASATTTMTLDRAPTAAEGTGAGLDRS